MKGRYLESTIGLLVVVTMSWPAVVADEFEQVPIEYSRSTPDNCVADLQVRLERGETTLSHDRQHGYLPAVLQDLGVPVESQMLVFSKTSLQRQRISPSWPRAVYFNDDVYVGYCHQGDVMELSAADPRLGTVFYTLDQRHSDRPRLTRQTENCLVCHGSSRTEGVPGHLIRSLFADTAGEPLLSAGSRSVDHTTPLADRWGGWYVTGTHGSQRHMGNLIISGRDVVEPVDNAAGQNVTDLSSYCSLGHYLSPHSDIVALMVFEHQALVHNRLTRASFTARQAVHYEAELNRALKNPADHHFESTARRIQSAGDDLVEALLLSREAPLTEPIRGTSGFAEAFSQQGPRDGQGRSLRDLDLTVRLFKYPCSYLIYSRVFDELPPPMRDYVWQRLWNVLNQDTPPPEFSHLARADRRAIIEIIRATKEGIPACWEETSE